jgi:predicted PurR-regulated permease PerM
MLLAIVLYGASRALAELTTLPRLVMLAAVLIAIAIFFGLVIATGGPTLAVQIAQLARGIAAGATTLTKEVASFADQANLLQNVDLVQMLSALGAVFGLLGLALATPLAAAATVPLRYVFGIGEDSAKSRSVRSKP